LIFHSARAISAALSPLPDACIVFTFVAALLALALHHGVSDHHEMAALNHQRGAWCLRLAHSLFFVEDSSPKYKSSLGAR
jgi:hypothetical protein